MNEAAKSLLKKALKFVFTSGIGFILDFCVYAVLTQLAGFKVMQANFISSMLGATFVFIVSTRKIFENSKKALPLPVKYGAYIAYQLVLIFAASWLGERIDVLINTYVDIWFILEYSKLASKILIVPFTITCNFFVMRFISERI